MIIKVVNILKELSVCLQGLGTFKSLKRKFKDIPGIVYKYYVIQEHAKLFYNYNRIKQK